VAWDPTVPVEVEPRRLVEVRVAADRAVPVLLAGVLLVSLAGLSGALVRAGVLHLDLPGLAGWGAATDPDLPTGAPSWFECALLVLAALVAWTAADDARADGDPRAGSWRGLAVGALVLSIDELTAVHQTVVAPVARLLGGGLPGDLAWGVVAVPAVVAAGVAGAGLLRSLPRSTSSGLVVAAALYVGGAVLLDVVGTALRSAVESGSLLLASASVVEEAMEMLGIVVLVLVVSRHAPAARRVERVALPATEIDLTPFEPSGAPVAPPLGWAIPGGAARGEVLSSGALSPPPPPPRRPPAD
jgi:hypothetical protein